LTTLDQTHYHSINPVDFNLFLKKKKQKQARARIGKDPLSIEGPWIVKENKNG